MSAQCNAIAMQMQMQCNAIAMYVHNCASDKSISFECGQFFFFIRFIREQAGTNQAAKL